MHKTIISFAWEIFVNSIESIMFLTLISNKLRSKINKYNFSFLSFLFFLSLICVLNFLKTPYTISYLVFFLISILFTNICFNNTIAEKVYWGGIYTFIMLFSDKFTFWIVSIFTSYNFSEFVFGGNARIYTTIIYLLVCFLFVSAFIRLPKKTFYFPPKLQIILIIVTILSIVISNSLLELIVTLDTTNVNPSIIKTLNHINYLFLFVFFALLLIVKWIGSIYQKNLELLEENQQVNVEKQQFEVFAETTQALREWKHDYKNTLSVLSMMLANEQLDKANRYLLELLATEPAPAFQISSGNSVLDAIVSTKLSIAKNQGIDFQHAIFLPKIIPFSPLDFSTIMGNLLDNAIKACEDVLADTSINLKPYVMLEIKPQMDMLYIRISNSSCGRYCYDTQGNLMSSKKEPGHGIGIKRIIKMVHKYDGIYQQEAESNHFTLTIMVPLLNYEETSL
ncbi:MAG: GHKL domain-containing protein [Lachnospiraceae bacterium]